MEILKKKIIFWVSLASAMAVVSVIWIMSLESHNFSESKEQIKKMKEQVQEKLQDIKMPEIGAGHALPSEKTPLLPDSASVAEEATSAKEATPAGKAKLELPLEE